jgi:formylglycine-generating enzyme required for sulfatase activity
MGSPEKESDRQSNENQHEVCVQSFMLGKFEVTQGQWEKVMLGNPSSISNGFGDNYPVNTVSWDDANKFIYRMNLFGKHHYRLPTEAEWEYAARAGTTTSRYWGDNDKAACQYGNVLDEKIAAIGGAAIGLWFSCDDGYAYSVAPVGQYHANAYGLYDMLGNVWEWTCSAYTERGYEGNENNRKNNADNSHRVIRGGSWDDGPTWVRSANRDRADVSYRDNLIGFRLVQDN